SDHTIFVSHDGGRSFVSHPGPCVPGLNGKLTTTPAAVWAVCATGMSAQVLRSTDGGAHFSDVPRPPISNSAVLAPGDPTPAVISVEAGLFRTGDASHWDPVYRGGEGSW